MRRGGILKVSIPFRGNFNYIFFMIVKLRQGSGKERQGKARKGKERQVWRKVKGLKA